MTVLVQLRDDREAATAASPRFTGPNWTPTPIPAGIEGWASFSRWANGGTDKPTLSAVYAEAGERYRRNVLPGRTFCAIEHGVIGALADNECKHDRLPTDPTPPCGCWRSEVVKDPPRVVEETTEVAEPKPETPVPALVVEAAISAIAASRSISAIAELEATKPETPVSGLGPADLVELPAFVAGLVERIDDELVRLRGERAAVLAFKGALHE